MPYAILPYLNGSVVFLCLVYHNLVNYLKTACPCIAPSSSNYILLNSDILILCEIYFQELSVFRFHMPRFYIAWSDPHLKIIKICLNFLNIFMLYLLKHKLFLYMVQDRYLAIFPEINSFTQPTRNNTTLK